jgi:hypothetical protein
MPAEEIKEHMRKSDTPMIEVFVCQIIIKGVQHGDPMRLEYLIGRVIGKYKEPAIDVTERNIKVEFVDAKS